MMIKILFIRHGMAENPRTGLADSQRALTSQGWTHARAAMKALVEQGLVPTRGVSSPFRRAQETLTCLREAVPGGFPADSWEGLQPEGSCGLGEAWLLGQILGASPEEVLAVVSHEPFLSHFLFHLTGARLPMANAACAVLHWQGGVFRLDSFISPDSSRAGA
jgi:phosphohistidine phosphatase